MRTLATLLAVAAIAAFGFTAPAMAGKPTQKVNHGHATSGFSAPFVANGGAEVSHSDGDGSKGDVDNDGNWGVITGQLPVPDVFYDICFAAEGVGDILLATELATGTDILTDNVTDNVGGSHIQVPTADYQVPRLRIYQDDDTDCAGGSINVLAQESGVSIAIDAD